ncbi:MAG: HEAT repeat domain-containing protein, partial [Elusimicrobiota bacterium]
MRRFHGAILRAVLAAALAACGELAVRPPEPLPLPDASAEKKLDPQITTTLVRLAEDRGKFKRDLSNSVGAPVGDLLLLGSPIGYNLRNRFLDIGLPLAEAFSANADPVFRQQLIEMARWDKDSESRASALIALAGSHDLAHLRIINEALIHLNPGVRFGALEALVVWGHPREAMPLLAAASERDTEPLLRVYAAAGLARLGDPAGLHRLRQFFDDPSWLVKAMTAKYIGELGTAEDYDILLNRLDGEYGNDFVVAEYCVAALKLYPQKRKP